MKHDYLHTLWKQSRWLFRGSVMISLLIIMIETWAIKSTPNAQANSAINVNFTTPHPDNAKSCKLCHIDNTGGPTPEGANACTLDPNPANCKLTENYYGIALQQQFEGMPRPISNVNAIKTAIATIAKLDSDEDGWSNQQEIVNQGNKHPGQGEAAPSISVAVTTDPAVAITNTQLSYTITIQNTSNHASVVPEITIVKVSGSPALDCTNLPENPIKKKGDTATVKCTVTVTDALIQNNKLSNLITVTFKPPSGIEKQVPTTNVVEVASIAPKLNLVVVPNIPTVVHGEKLTYQITVTNESTLSGSIDDDLLVSMSSVNISKDGQACSDLIPPIATLPKDTPMSLQCTIEADKVNGGNISTVFSASGVLDNGESIEISKTITVLVESRKREFSLDVAHSIVRSAGGDNIHLTFSITNTGNVLMSGIKLTVTRFSACAIPFTSIAAHTPQSPFTCNAIIASDLIEEINGQKLYSLLVTLSGIDNFDKTITETHKIIDIDVAHYAYLPFVASVTQSESTTIDLIVSAIDVNDRGVAVTIKNIGTGTLTNTGYWVDLYINPTYPPTQVNQLARDWGDYGLVWGVPLNALPLPANGELLLQAGDSYCAADLSEAPGSIAAGSKIYVQVDSANKHTNYGGVLEKHEIAGDFYNNIESITLPEILSTARWAVCQAASTNASSVERNKLQSQTPR